MLQNKAGVNMVLRLVGHPNLMALVEAPTMNQLVKETLSITECFENITEDLNFLVPQEKELLPV
jgi:hypothetical protein